MPNKENLDVHSYEDDLDPLVFHAILVELDEVFKQRLIAAYSEDRVFHDKCERSQQHV